MKKALVLGLKENAGLFALLVVMSGFVGTMVGIERSLLPELTAAWGIRPLHASFIMVGVFGVSKASANLVTGHLIGKFGRKPTLTAGWFLALFTPVLLSLDSAPIFGILANIVLGLSQGITWSTTVIMKIDIVGTSKRGTAMGLNESAGYVAVGLASAVGAWYVQKFSGVEPLLLGTGCIALLALLLAHFSVPETAAWVALEAQSEPTSSHLPHTVFAETTWKNKALRNITWSGVVNNANDGILWAVLPILLVSEGHALTVVGTLTAVHASVWGLGQLITGPLSNRRNIKALIVPGMAAQGLGLLLIPILPTSFLPYLLIGGGTAMVYPTFLVGVSNHAPTHWRPKALSTYRFWRDIGYVFGGLIGWMAITLGSPIVSFNLIGIITTLAAVVFAMSYPNKTP